MASAYVIAAEAEGELEPLARSAPAGIGAALISNNAEVPSFWQKMSGIARRPGYL